ncbi:peroxiredoxin family protein [Flavobacterium soyae]|uniref:Redoxin domain-containing protein n=1 Tax=Flavobacterium soyae TaxID=2903098 RepID=A0ABZ2UF22_9FLAO
MKKMLLGSLAVLAMQVSVQAQTINVNFAHFAGKEYVYLLERGDKKDTIAKGKLDETGKTIIIIPASKKGYAGVSNFVLTDGGGMDFTINNENFTVSCKEEQPNFENTKYTGSPENEFINDWVKKQGELLAKARAIQGGLAAYNKEETFYLALEKEKENLNRELKALKTSTAESKLYAAKLTEIYAVLMGASGSLDSSELESAQEINVFVRDKLDMTVLYNSGQWSNLIEGWMQLQQSIIKDDTAWFAGTKQILSRIKSNEIYTAFTEKVVILFTKAGRDGMVAAISEYAQNSGRLEKPTQRLLNTINSPLIGVAAPALQTAAGKKKINKKTLLFFYESGCDLCENEIYQLIDNYKIVKSKGYEIISVAADMTKDAADGHNHTFPWKEQLCDYKGFAGPNFQTYAIIGTPTFFTIDEKGKITGKYARLIDTNILK